MKFLLVLSTCALLPIALAAAPMPRAAPKVKVVPLGPNIVLEVEGKVRRVVVKAAVCLREGPLEGLLTRAKKKEHEYILAADVDARQIHAALAGLGAKVGAPVQFAPQYKPASGSRVKLRLRYQDGGKTVVVPASAWVREAKTKKNLDRDWVFGGSKVVPHPDDPNKPYYLANHGDLVCLCNMETAMLDLPVKSPKKFDQRIYEAHTQRIPPLETAVEVLFEPVK
jgi:hypothetical protein